MNDQLTKALIKKVIKGDANAYGQLIAQYGNATMGYLINMVKNKSQAEDIYQTAWLKLPSKLHQFDTKQRFEPWLITLVRNTALDYLRREGVHKRVINLDEVKHVSISGQALDDRVIDSVCLDEALMTLSSESRQIILLRYMSDLSYQDIASTMQLEVNDVRWKLYEAKKKLKVFLKDRGITKWIAN